jgi:hypothetical protein
MEKFNLGAIQTRNIGGYRPAVISGESFILDRITYNRFINHVDSVTNLLYLNLSRGIRVPAFLSSRVTFIESSLKPTSLEHIADYSVVLDGTNIDYIRFFVNEDLAILTEVNPLAFCISSDLKVMPFIGGVFKQDETCYCDVLIRTLGDGP